MPVTPALSIAQSGLQAAKLRAQVAASNVANANTEGYVRRTADVSQRTIAWHGAGVQVNGTNRAEVPHLTAERMRAEAESLGASETAEGIARLTQILGEPSAQTGLFGAYVAFENAMRDAAMSPESPVMLSELHRTAGALTKSFAEASGSVDRMRNEAEGEIAATVSEVNVALKRLEELNGLSPAQQTPAVADERQQLVDRINREIPVEVLDKGAGIHLMTEGGVFLLTSQAQDIEFSPANLVSQGQVLGAPLSGLTVNGIDITPTGDGHQRTREGRLAGLFGIRDQSAPDFQASLDALATDLVTRFSGTAVDPSNAPGEAGLFTDGGATAPAGLGLGIAGRLELHAAIDPAQGGELRRLRDGIGSAVAGPAGNGEQLGRMLDALTSGQGADKAVAELSSELGAAEKAASDRAMTANIHYRAAAEAETIETGVDTDRELQDLMMIEQAYAANARVLQTVNAMLDTLMEAV
ncbi:flagellar hook-associated protein FlgK [Parvularcula oceani]|uniref:flagellar hook-associated protein FlgK n=1 Tax=Parvularcula oceani TaxID=1247963 RepID=UPI00056D17DD|nr:flagellar hook-associated protein FlgK [Parvularcula oceani]